MSNSKIDMRNEAQQLFFEGAVSSEEPEYSSIEDKIVSWKKSMRDLAHDSLHEPLIIMDEALRYIFALSELCRGMDRENNVGIFEFQLAKIRCDLISIRELMLMGQGSAAQAVGRALLEDLEVAMAILVDDEFANDYYEMDSDEFWSRQIGYGKISKQVRAFLSKARHTEEEVEWQLQRHRELKGYFSKHVHASFYSTLKSALPKALGPYVST